jgi:hypothetical protein
MTFEKLVIWFTVGGLGIFMLMLLVKMAIFMFTPGDSGYVQDESCKDGHVILLVKNADRTVQWHTTSATCRVMEVYSRGEVQP